MARYMIVTFADPAQLQHLDMPSRLTKYRPILARSQAVVLLDNASTVEQVRPQVANVLGCVTLITSRRSLAGLPNTWHLQLDVFTPKRHC